MSAAKADWLPELDSGTPLRAFDVLRADYVRNYPLTEGGLAERLVARHGSDMRYDHIRRRWVIYDLTRWADNYTAEPERRVKDTVRTLLAAAMELEGQDRDAAVRCALKHDTARAVQGILNRAAAEPGMQVLPGDLDSDSLLLNVGNGTIALRTGEIREHRREDYISKLASVKYDQHAKAPRWIRFLLEIFDGDGDLVEFVQRAVGYTLTGLVREHCLFLLWGVGRNGKSVFLTVLLALLGEYGFQADFQTFLSVQRESRGPREDIASLVGRRFVAASEVREGARLDEAIVKHLTGGDTVRARHLYEGSFEFKPASKIWLACNHRPAVRDTSLGFWSRVRLIPFTQIFEGDRQDQHLTEKLLTELPGILNWAVEGCLRWQEEGLAPPSAVLNATEQYRGESDAVGRFIEDRCVVGDSFTVRARALYEAYRAWATAAGEDSLTETSFAGRIADRGITKSRTSRGLTYRGIGLQTESEAV